MKSSNIQVYITFCKLLVERNIVLKQCVYTIKCIIYSIRKFKLNSLAVFSIIICVYYVCIYYELMKVV